MGNIQAHIKFFSEGIKFTLKKKLLIKNWIKTSILLEKKEFSEINIIFTSDEYLKSLNINYLKKSYLTDIITFQYSFINPISGDIYISIERVKDNAHIFSQSFENELHRIIIHGVLHLIGYKDKTKKDKNLMTVKENYYLKKLIIK